MTEKTLQKIDIFISSPGDVNEERKITLEVIEQLNSMPHIADRYTLKPLAYEEIVPAAVGETPQRTVDRYMMQADKADIFICILWGRMGTPVIDSDGKEYRSGTEYEFTTAYRANQKSGKPAILLYRGIKSLSMDADFKQAELVKDFFKRFEGKEAEFKGLYRKYKSNEDFKDILFKDINKIISSDIISSHAVSGAGITAFPQIWNVPHSRNNNFTGREDMLSQLRGALTSGENAAWKQTLTGLGGVGKSQVAVEYIYRHLADYRLVWWIRSEEATSMAGDYASLAWDLNLQEKDLKDQPEIVRAVKRWLENGEGWLLVFDNAQNPEDIRNYLPQGGAGHVIITSRNPNWSGVSKLRPIKRFKPPESIDFLCKRTGQDDKEVAGALAYALGDLPLALEQGGAYIETTGIPMKEYLNLFNERRKELWKDESPPLDYPQPVGAAWSLAMDRVRDSSPEGADLLNLCSFLAPDDIPLELVREGTEHLPPQLAAAATDRLVMNRAIKALRQYSLIEIGNDNLSVHRLVQAVVRDRLGDDETKLWAGSALRVLRNAFPYNSDDVQTWPLSKRLLPHALATAAHTEAYMVAKEDIGYILNKTGLYLMDHAEFSKARTDFEKALAIYKELYGIKHADVAATLNNIGLAWRNRGYLKRAIKYHEQALAIYKKVYRKKHPDVAASLNYVGLAWRNLGLPRNALEYYKQALAIYKEVYGEIHPDVAATLNNIGLAWKNLNDPMMAPMMAIKYHEQALAIYKKVYGEIHPDVAATLNNIGVVWKSYGDPEKAIKFYEQALAIYKKVYGEIHPDVADTLNNIGLALDTFGDPEGAIEYHEQALAIRKGLYGEIHPDVAASLNNIGEAWRNRGYPKKAIEFCEQALAIYKKVYEKKHPHMALCLDNIGSAWLDSGDSKMAKKYFQEAYEMMQRIKGDEHSLTRTVKTHLDTGCHQ